MDLQNEQLVAIRPIIDIEFTEAISAVERFMHETLRPILKFQHQFIKEIIETEPRFNELDLIVSSHSEARKYVKTFISKSPALRFQLVGSIIGLMTTEERMFYFQNRLNLSKRIVEMIITRFLSNYHE